MHTTHFRKLAWLCMLFDIVKTNICNLNSGVINAPARRESWAVWNATTAHVSHAATLKSPQTVAARAMQTTLNIYGMYAFAHTHTHTAVSKLVKSKHSLHVGHFISHSFYHKQSATESLHNTAESTGLEIRPVAHTNQEAPIAQRMRGSRLKQKHTMSSLLKDRSEGAKPWSRDMEANKRSRL